MQAACEKELARMEAAYAGVVGHLESVRAALAEEPMILDPTEQSQKIMTPRRAYTYTAPRVYRSTSTPTDTSPSPGVYASAPSRAYASPPNRAARGHQSVKASAFSLKPRGSTKSKPASPSPSAPGPSALPKGSRTTIATARTSLSGMSRAHDPKL